MQVPPQRGLLPPITAFLNTPPQWNTITSDEAERRIMTPVEKAKPATFTLSEDITILKAIRYYIGSKPGVKIPWSFWQLYRKFSGSKRSDSSLYHHWNGSMIKKFGSILKDGTIDECIRWAEDSLLHEAANASSIVNSVFSEQMSAQNRLLLHTNSYSYIPIQYSQTNMGMFGDQNRQLTHFASMQNYPVFPIHYPGNN